MNRYLYLMPSILFATAIFIVSNQHNMNLPDLGFDSIDKVLHSLAYLLFGLSLMFAICGLKPEISRNMTMIILLIIGIFYAIGDEIHQHFIPGRNFDVYDIIADITGVFVSYYFYNFLRSVYRKWRINIV